MGLFSGKLMKSDFGVELVPVLRFSDDASGVFWIDGAYVPPARTYARDINANSDLLERGLLHKLVFGSGLMGEIDRGGRAHVFMRQKLSFAVELVCKSSSLFPHKATITEGREI